MSFGIVASNCFKKLLTLARAEPLITTELEKNQKKAPAANEINLFTPNFKWIRLLFSHMLKVFICFLFLLNTLKQT